ncbi:vacuolar protein sorting-associated protein [Salix suchowensis]|nr:vacuolar protein sorting-associated protein [Salix suchowensis]
MGEGDMPMDDKAKRMRDLLSSFYSPDPSVTNTNKPLKFGSLDVINTTSFDADQYMNLLVRKSNLEGLLQKHVEMASEIKNLDTDLQMLVYENYNKFISATDTIKRMKTNIVGMETNMEQLLDKIMTVQSKSDGVNTKLFEKREHIEKLHRTRNLLRKVQFIYDLPSRLGKCIKSEAYADAVRFYIGAMPIFKAYGDSSFQDCKRASEEAMAMIIKNLQGKLFSDSESIQARAEAAVLLKQLDFPVDSLKAKLFEKLEQSLDGLQLTHEVIAIVSVESSNLSEQGNNTESVPGSAHGALVSEFAEAVRAYQIIFPDSEKQLIKLSQDLITKHFEITSDYIKKWIPIANFLGVLRIIWKDVLLIDTVLHEALLSDYSSKVVLLFQLSGSLVKQYIKSTFSHLLHDISDALTNVYIKPREKLEEHPLVVFLEAGKSSVLQGSVNVLLDFRQLLEENLEESIPGLVLVLAQLSVFIERTAISRITELLISLGAAERTHENGPAFVPGEICRTFHSAGEMLHSMYELNLSSELLILQGMYKYINKNSKISILLRKRFTTPNWFKVKVHMFVDLFLQEVFEAVESRAKQILPWSTSQASSLGKQWKLCFLLSNSLRDDKMSRSNTHRARSQLLEKHLANLTWTDSSCNLQESVVTTVVKLCLKTIQLDVQFLRAALKEIVEDEAAVDFLLDEPPILDKLIQVKLAKEKEQTPISP